MRTQSPQSQEGATTSSCCTEKKKKKKGTRGEMCCSLFWVWGGGDSAIVDSYIILDYTPILKVSKVLLFDKPEKHI